MSDNYDNKYRYSPSRYDKYRENREYNGSQSKYESKYEPTRFVERKENNYFPSSSTLGASAGKEKDNKVYSQDFLDNMERQFESSQINNLARLRETETMYTRESETLRDEIQKMKARLSANSEEYHMELKQLHDKFRLDMETAISQKDALIKSMEAKIDNVRRQTEEEITRQSKLREEHLEMKLNHNNQVTELTHSLRKKEHELEELKHEHYVVTQERLNGLIKEKSQLRDTFESSILKLKEAHVKDMTSLNEELTREKDHSIQLSEELRKLRVELEDRLRQLQNDKAAVESSVGQCRRLNEMQVEENHELKKAVEEFRKENDMLNKEIKLLNEECNKLRMDNDDLRNSCVKLDKIVYGKKDKAKKK